MIRDKQMNRDEQMNRTKRKSPFIHDVVDHGQSEQNAENPEWSWISGSEEKRGRPLPWPEVSPWEAPGSSDALLQRGLGGSSVFLCFTLLLRFLSVSRHWRETKGTSLKLFIHMIGDLKAWPRNFIKILTRMWRTDWPTNLQRCKNAPKWSNVESIDI